MPVASAPRGNRTSPGASAGGPKLRASALGACLGALALLCLARCQTWLGDFTLESTSCKSGAVQCFGNVLQACSSDGTAWKNRTVCASEKLCDPALGMCLPPLCATGERRCKDAELQVCNATRDAWERLDTCATAGRCSAESGSCTDQPCQPGELQCNGSELQSCSGDQSSWDLVRDGQCESAALCNKDKGLCEKPICQLGDFNCASAELQTCNATLNGWTTVQSCDSDALCDKESGTCGAGQCTIAGEFRCTDTGALESCTDDLTAWALVESCQSAAHCDAVNGVCTDAPCTAGNYQCNGATLDVCNADTGGWDPVATCQTDGLCQATRSANETACRPPLCKAGETRCVDGQPQICNAGLTEFRANGPACATVELCVDGACAPPVCAPNDRRCTSAQPAICNPGRTGFVADGMPCASVALCNQSTGTCGDQKCVAGQLRCDPQNPTHLQRCKDDLTDWEPEPCDICATSELCSGSLGATTCDATSCAEPVCDAGAPHCGGSGADDGKILETCSPGRTGYTPCQTCVTKELCVVSLDTKPFSCTASACTPPSCNPTDRWCGGSGNTTLYQCPQSRINSKADALDSCETNGLCELTRQEGETTCEEPTCSLSDLWCGGNGNTTLYQCPASRINTQAVNLGTCASNALCEISHQARKTTCEPPKCSTGATQCGGTGNLTLQMCRTDRTGFMDCDTCGSAQLCTDSLGATTCNSSACLACTTGEAHCVGGNYQTCRTNRSGFDVTDCMGNGCDETLGGCLMPDAGVDGG